jgi:hypothetical protein
MSKLSFVIMAACGLYFVGTLGMFFLGDSPGTSLMRSFFAFLASVVIWKLFSR